MYAVDAGHGQLLGSLRQDPRVVNLESTNLGDLSVANVPDVVEVVTLDLSYVSLAVAVPQLEDIEIARDADLVALVKPQFELRLAAPPRDESTLERALERARSGIERSEWSVVGSCTSPVRGGRGAVEFLVHAVRRCG